MGRPWWQSADGVRRFERALAVLYVLMSVLAACGGERIDGPAGFAVDEAILAPCRDVDGNDVAVALAVSRRDCWPAPGADDVGLCDAFFDAYVQTQEVCSPDPVYSNRSRTLTGYFADVPSRDDLAGGTAQVAWVIDCLDEDRAREVPALGAIEITEDRGDVAMVRFETDTLQGDVPFTVCR